MRQLSPFRPRDRFWIGLPEPIRGGGHSVLYINYFRMSPHMVMATTTASRPTIAVSPDAQIHLRERRLSVEDYFAMGKAGILGDDDRVELLDGRLIDMPPIGPPHSHSVDNFEELLARRLYKPEQTVARIRIQSPIRLGEYSAPEPDVVLYDSDMPKNRHPRPDDIYLVVEVADATVDYDRQVKADRYAAAGIPEYWLVDLPGEAVDVFRRPEEDGFAERSRHRRGDAISVSALPELEAVSVKSVLP
jgi:Uma2 family endonuclease